MCKYKIIILIMLCFLVLNGCSKQIKSNNNISQEVSISSNSYKIDKKYNLFIRSKVQNLAKYEPSEGSYLGAYILSNKYLDFDINKFENFTKKKHAIYMYNLKLGDEFPEEWILSCISKIKIPSIVIKPPNEYNPFNETHLMKTAKDFGKYDIPMFVHFYPNPSSKNYSANLYKEFFKKAKLIFSKHAPNVAFVYSVKHEDVFEYKQYYPGDEYTDWVGLNIVHSIDKHKHNIFSSIDYLYYSFQKTKPMMISQFAVSYFDKKEGNYYTTEAQNEIKNLYSNIKNYYPRIKAIIYFDYNGEENFSITDNMSTLNIYKNVVIDDYFKEYFMENQKDIFDIVIKSPFDVVRVGNDYFISEKSVVYDMDNFEIYRKLDSVKNIDNQKYYNLKLFKNVNIKTDEELNKIIINK